VIQLCAARTSGPRIRSGATVAVFILCWSPYFVFGLLQVYGHVPNTQRNIAVATFIQSLAPLNSAANPIIYCLFSTRMRRTLR
jgi:neuropeptide S receptor 1